MGGGVNVWLSSPASSENKFCAWCFHFSGFEEFQIVHRHSLGSGKYKYSALQIKDEIPYELHISGASERRDPLKEIQMIKLRVDDNTITGMDDNGDCVVRKS